MKRLLIVLIAISFSTITIAQPWSVNSADYEFSMNVIGQVSIDNSVIDQQDSYIGAFVDDVCVGVCSPTNDEGEYKLFYLTIYSNESFGESVEFKFLDSMDVESSIANTIEFGSDLIIGDYENPFLWMDVEAYASTDFLSFSFDEEFSPAVINPAAKTIDIVVVHDANLSLLIPSFELSPGASVEVNSVLQESGVTANDYSSSVVYSVTGVDASTSNWIVSVTLDNSAVAQFNSDMVSIYPNPVSDFIQIDMKDVGCDEIQIIDIQGRIVIKQDLTNSDFQIDISNLKSGVYFVRFSKENTIQQYKFVKQ